MIDRGEKRAEVRNINRVHNAFGFWTFKGYSFLGNSLLDQKAFASAFFPFNSSLLWEDIYLYI